MPRVSPVCLLVCCGALLGACARESDAFRPRIIITQPEAGSVSRQNSSVVRGYALDDQAIRAIRVNGQPLALPAGSRKIVPFAFKTSTSTDRADYVIEATDNRNLSTKVELPLRYDPNPPSITITRLERDGATLRITGVASDDLEVASITVDGSKLGISSGTRVPFYAESSGPSAEVVVTDGAGNTTRKRVK